MQQCQELNQKTTLNSALQMPEEQSGDTFPHCSAKLVSPGTGQRPGLLTEAMEQQDGAILGLLLGSSETWLSRENSFLTHAWVVL